MTLFWAEHQVLGLSRPNIEPITFKCRVVAQRVMPRTLVSFLKKDKMRKSKKANLNNQTHQYQQLQINCTFRLKKKNTYIDVLLYKLLIINKVVKLYF